MKKILGVCIGSCIHIAGIHNFLTTAKTAGYETRFSGSAVDIDKLAEEIEEYNPDIVAISYRLSPESIMPVFRDLEKMIKAKPQLQNIEYILGTTKPVAEIAEKTMGDTIDRAVRETVSETAEKVIREAIDTLKQSIASSEL